MKRTAAAVVIGSLFLATQALAAGSPFPERGPRGLPSQSTYADLHADDPIRVTGSPFPEGADGEPRGLSPQDADRFLSEMAVQADKGPN